MLTRGFANCRYMTPVMGIGAVLGLNMAMLCLATAVFSPMFIIVGLLSGPVVAVYGPMIYLSRDFHTRTVLGGALLAATGFFHLPWMLGLSNIISTALPASAVGVSDAFPAPILVTGGVFAIVIGGITTSWRAFGVLIAGTAIASLVGAMELLLPSVGLAFGVAIAVLHLSIVGTLLFTTLATVAARERPGVCKSCGYDLAGSVGGVCPECGFDALRPAPHPFDVEVTSERPRE